MPLRSAGATERSHVLWNRLSILGRGEMIGSNRRVQIPKVAAPYNNEASVPRLQFRLRREEVRWVELLILDLLIKTTM